jgi:NADH-quinone oxidoreductase subunit M
MVFFAMASVGLPGLNGFVGEFLTLLGSFTSVLMGPVYAAVAATGLIFGAIYILYMVGKVVWGPLKLPEGHDDPHHVKDLNGREITVLIPLALACLWLGLYPNCMLKTLDAPSQAIVQRLGLDDSDTPLVMPMHHVSNTINLQQESTLQGAQQSAPAVAGLSGVRQ